jgi:hypothetical protein
MFFYEIIYLFQYNSTMLNTLQKLLQLQLQCNFYK